jgi:glutathione synthase/RimK-type ligase-like ATP-grasp enzyme
MSGGNGMYENTIGILLSKREWKKLTDQEEQHETCAHQYSRIAKDLGIEVAFFSIHDISILEQKGKSFSLEHDGTVIKNDSAPIPSIIYNPIKYNLKKNIKKLRALSQIPGIKVINEHHYIKKKHFFNLLQSCEELAPFIDINSRKSEYPFFLYVLLQKDEDGKWKISATYVKDQEDKVFFIEEASDIFFQGQLKIDQLKHQLDIVNASIGELIHYYYPGVYEVGIQFKCKQDGSIYIQSTYPLASVVKDLSKKEQLLLEVITWPMQLAFSLIKRESKLHNVDTEKNFTNSIPANPEDIRKNGNYSTIWARMKEFTDEEKIIKLPKNLIRDFNLQSIKTKFGIKEVESKLVMNDESLLLQNNSAKAPFEIFVSSSLIKELKIPTDIVYQLIITKEKIIIGPTVGLLLGEKNQIYHLDYMKKYSDRFGEYEKFGGMVIAFSTRSINWEKRIVHGMIYNHDLKAWRYGTAPIPSSIYRRNFHQNPAEVNKLMKLTNNKVFNSHPFNKADLYNLQNETELENQVPKTNKLKSIDELIDFLYEKQKVILKPESLSRGRGIFILELKKGEQEEYILYDYRKKKRSLHVVQDPKALYEMLSELDIFKQAYLYQTYIPLLKVNHRLFDIRVVMQKKDINQWMCTGIECRVAGVNKEITNIARGGDAMTLDEVIAESGNKFSLAKVYWSILKVCYNFCRLIDKRPGHFAEFGIDIALDEDGMPWLLEANIYPSFKGFKKLDYPTYLNIRYQPLYYAVRLQGFEVKEEGAGLELYNQEKSYR